MFEAKDNLLSSRGEFRLNMGTKKSVANTHFKAKTVSF